MALYRRILVPVDDGPAAQAGLHAAINLAQDQAAELKIVSVADETSEGYAGAELGWLEAEGLDKLLRADAERFLDEATNLAVAAGLTPERELIEAPDGHVAQHIAQAAAAWQADLVVVGTQGRQGLLRWLVGSTSEALLRGLSLPLLVVPCPQESTASE